MSKLALIALLAAAGLAGVAQATPAAQPASTRSCFWMSEWEGWSAPDSQTLLLKVNRDVYRLTLKGKASSLNWPDTRLISEGHGSNRICSARDLD